jgi:Flagellar hook-length control protein FliK
VNALAPPNGNALGFLAALPNGIPLPDATQDPAFVHLINAFFRAGNSVSDVSVPDHSEMDIAGSKDFVPAAASTPASLTPLAASPERIAEALVRSMLGSRSSAPQAEPMPIETPAARSATIEIVKPVAPRISKFVEQRLAVPMAAAPKTKTRSAGVSDAPMVAAAKTDPLIQVQVIQPQAPVQPQASIPQATPQQPPATQTEAMPVELAPPSNSSAAPETVPADAQAPAPNSVSSNPVFTNVSAPEIVESGAVSPANSRTPAPASESPQDPVSAQQTSAIQTRPVAIRNPEIAFEARLTPHESVQNGAPPKAAEATLRAAVGIALPHADNQTASKFAVPGIPVPQIESGPSTEPTVENSTQPRPRAEAVPTRQPAATPVGITDSAPIAPPATDQTDSQRNVDPSVQNATVQVVPAGEQAPGEQNRDSKEEHKDAAPQEAAAAKNAESAQHLNFLEAPAPAAHQNDVTERIVAPQRSVAETIRTSEPSQAVTAAPRSEPVQQIAVRIARPDAPAVDLHLAERGGQIHVSVRTPDAALQASLRQDLGTLSSSLNRAGYHTETFVPRATAEQAGSSSEMNSREGRQPQPGFSGRGGHGDSSQSRQQRQRDPRAFNWLEELENSK